MVLNEQKRIEFDNVTRILIKWLNDNCHPHTKIIIDTNSAELVEGVCAFRTNDYIKN